jgi:hypothetical protein
MRLCDLRGYFPGRDYLGCDIREGLELTGTKTHKASVLQMNRSGQFSLELRASSDPQRD